MTLSPDSPTAQLLRAVAHYLECRRPLAVMDLETTGVNPELDRVVELTIARIEPVTYAVQALHSRVNPCRPIPLEATAVHGISDADVKDAPSFRQLAPMVCRLLAGADLIGFNHRRFDVRMIASELKLFGFDNPCEGARLVDVGLIFMKREPRTLEAAVQFFCGDRHADAHGTTADVEATLRVLLAQFERYTDLPRDLDELDAIGRDPSFIDRDGKFVWRGGRACIGFGKYQGVPLEECDRSFLSWMLSKDFSNDAKAIARDALSGKFPRPPTTADVVPA